MNKYNSSDFFKMIGIKASIDIETYERDMKEKEQELERYKNIINELEKYLKEVPNNNADNIQYGRESLAEDLKDLIKKLKGE